MHILFYHIEIAAFGRFMKYEDKAEGFFLYCVDICFGMLKRSRYNSGLKIFYVNILTTQMT